MLAKRASHCHATDLIANVLSFRNLAVLFYMASIDVNVVKSSSRLEYMFCPTSGPLPPLLLQRHSRAASAKLAPVEQVTTSDCVTGEHWPLTNCWLPAMCGYCLMSRHAGRAIATTRGLVGRVVDAGLTKRTISWPDQLYTVWCRVVWTSLVYAAGYSPTLLTSLHQLLLVLVVQRLGRCSSTRTSTALMVRNHCTRRSF